MEIDGPQLQRLSLQMRDSAEMGENNRYMVYAPIALFAYNRPWHIRQTVEALLKNAEASNSDLTVFSDGAKDDASQGQVNKVRQYLKTIEGFKSVRIIKREKNLGLAQNIISGVTNVVDEHDKAIVLEDDLITSPFFLNYMNNALDCYSDNEQVISLSAYMYPVDQLSETLFLKGADCWGWATWKRGWDLFESDGAMLLAGLAEREMLNRFDFFGSYNFSGMLKRQIAGKNQSWAVRWYASALLKDKLTLYPGKTLVQHTGSDGSGTHFDNDGGVELFYSPVYERPIHVGDIHVEEDREALEAIGRFLKSTKPSISVRVFRKLNQTVERLLTR